MGKATRWLRGLFGMNKGKENEAHNETKEKKSRRSFVKNGKDSGGMREIPAADTAWLRSLIAESDKEQKKHAIAVAAATVAAADAAVAAAHAAAAVVRLTGKSGVAPLSGSRERLAALKIQTYFRGFLARKALRALRGLVKLQALVKGYLVRKRAKATLHSMQALIRAQGTARSLRAHGFRSTKPIEILEEESPKIVEIDTFGPKSRSRRMSTCLSEYDLDHHYLQDFEWGFAPEECRFATAQNTPRFGFSGPVLGPAKSVCGDSLHTPQWNCPSYMANTQSFKAKLRSQSAPKQRPRPGPNKRISINEMMASRSSFSSIRMQR